MHKRRTVLTITGLVALVLSYPIAVIATISPEAKCQYSFGKPLPYSAVSSLGGDSDIARAAVTQWLDRQKGLFTCPGHRLTNYRIKEIAVQSSSSDTIVFSLSYDYQVDPFPGRWHLTGEGVRQEDNLWHINATICSITLHIANSTSTSLDNRTYGIINARTCGAG